jgi:hypothetical protein
MTNIYIDIFMYRSVPLCTFQFLLISNKFCDLRFLQWLLFRALLYKEMWKGGGSAVSVALEARYDTSLQPVKVTNGNTENK